MGERIADLLLLIARGADLGFIKESNWTLAQINYVHEDGRTPLMSAIGRRDGPMISWLLSKGADVDTVDRAGRNALHVALLNAMRYGIDDFIYQLLRHNPRPNTVCRESGSFPLALAIALREESLIRDFYRCGVDLNMTSDIHRLPALSMAVRTGYYAGIKTLIELGADVHYQSETGSGILEELFHYASRAFVDYHNYQTMTYPEFTEIFELCVEHGAKIGPIDEAKSYKFSSASYFCPPEVLLYMMKEGLHSYHVLGSLSDAIDFECEDNVRCILQQLAITQQHSCYGDDMIREKVKPYYRDCQTELSTLKEIHVQNHTLFEILTLDIPKDEFLNKIFREVVCQIELDAYEDKIVLYKDRFHHQLLRFKRQKELWDSAMFVLGRIFNVHADDYYNIFEDMMELLSIQDARNICLADIAQRPL